AFVAETTELARVRVAERVAQPVLDVTAGERRDDLVTAHADMAVDPPHRQDDLLGAKRPVPRERVLVVRVDERAVEIEQRGAAQEAAFVFVRCPAWTPSANSSSILALKAGRSSGLRLVTRPWSTTTSWSTQSPPALRMSVCSVGHDVSVRPRTTPASTSTHGPWQITAAGLPCSKNERTNATAFSSPR